MNTQPPRQHEVLSDEERELARVVRALPGGEPPSALDALILKAATDAVASSHPQKHSRWKKGLLGTSALWLGTAAASVLTVSIGWQVFQSMSAPIYELPDNENVTSTQEVDSSHKSNSITIDMIPAREPAPTSPAPQEAESQASDMYAADAAAPAAPEAKADVMKSEMRAREDATRQQTADTSLAKKSSDDKQKMRRDQAAEQDWIPQSSGIIAPAASPSPPPSPVAAASPAAASSGYAEHKEMESIEITGSRIKRVDQEEAGIKNISRDEIARLAIGEDAKLRPELWIDAINERVKRNDIEGAKASLKLYRETYPKLRIPEKLKPLLK